MGFRFTAPELLKLGRPPDLASKPFETLRESALQELLSRFQTAGISYQAQNLEADTAAILSRSAASRDLLRRRVIDDAVSQTYLGSATDRMLDHRADDFGVLRRVVQFADPLQGLPEILEDDDSLRLRARLSWEALSVAGPAGAYVFHAVDAHPGAFDALPIGPETGIVQPGEVMIVVQGRDNNGVPSAGMLDVIASRLDAYEVVYPDGTSVLRPVRDLQSVRPLGARVKVIGAKPLVYNTTATLYIGPYADAEALRLQALEKLTAYQDRCRRIWQKVSREGRQAALSLVGADGLPVIDEVEVEEDDVNPTHLEIPVPGTVTLTMVVR